MAAAAAERRARTRRALRIGGAAAALLVLGVVVGELAGWPFLRQPLANRMSQMAGVPVQLDGRFSTRLVFSPQMRVEHLNVGAGGGVQVPHLVDARNLHLAWRWGDVWRWRQGEPLRIQRLEAGALDARLVRNAEGRASWQIGGDRTAKPKDEQRDGDTLPRFGAFIVNQGLVIVDDPTIQTQLRIDIAGREGDALPAADQPGQQAGYRAAINGRWRALPLQLQVAAGGSLPLLNEEPGAPLLPLRVQGQAGAAGVLFDGQGGALLGARKLDGRVEFRGPSLATVFEPLGVTLPHTPPFALQGGLAHDAGLWHLRAERATIGSSRLAGVFDFDTRPEVPLLKGKLEGQRLALADLGPAVGTDGTGDRKAAANKPPPGRVLPDRRFDLPSLRAMNADVAVAIDELALGSDKVSSLRQLRTHVLLDGGVLALDKLQASVAGGTFGGTTKLDANARPALWNVDLRFNTVDIAGWITALKTPAGDATQPDTQNAGKLKARRDQARRGGDGAPAKAYLTGAVNGHIKATGRGQSTAEILRTLDGQAHVFLRDGTLSHLATEAAGLDLAQALGVVFKGDQPLPLQCARLDLDIQNGVVRPRVGVLDNPDTTIRIGGMVDLRNETLDLRAEAKPRDFSPFSLRTPVTVKGTFANPDIGIEGGRLAGKAVGALALGAAVAPLAALLPFMDPGAKDEAGCTPREREQGAQSVAGANPQQGRGRETTTR